MVYMKTHTYIHTYIHTHTRTRTHTYMHTYIHTYIHTYMHTYMHTYIHTYIHIQEAANAGESGEKSMTRKGTREDGDDSKIGRALPTINKHGQDGDSHAV